MVPGARKSLVNAAFEEAAWRLAGLREQPGYEAILWALLCEIFQEMGHDVRLLVNSKDAETVRRLLAEHGIIAEVEPVLNSWGGVVAQLDQFLTYTPLTKPAGCGIMLTDKALSS